MLTFVYPTSVHSILIAIYDSLTRNINNNKFCLTSSLIFFDEQWLKSSGLQGVADIMVGNIADFDQMIQAKLTIL